MASIVSFGSYLPERILDNAALAGLIDCEASWILEVSGIEQRRVAADGETIASMAASAARNCLERAAVPAGDIGLVILASGTSERRFPGPAAQLAASLGIAGVPAIDLPIASAGSLFGLALAAQLTAAYGTILVAAAEKMSAAALAEPLDRNVAILFGDGAGACLVTADSGELEIVGSKLHTDGAYSESLHLDFMGPVRMDGRSVILQAARRLPAVISEVLERNRIPGAEIKAFVLHQANQNLLDRVAKALGVPPERFFSNIRACGNTSSASLLIAAAEWHENARLAPGDLVCFAAFGAGVHWGALLIRKTTGRWSLRQTSPPEPDK